MTAEPREANTEGGIFPAIFGTVMMVMLMSVFVTPFGVVAAVYLREYARQGIVTRAIRIAVNNLAGVPSIVYGVFGLGFFIYILGAEVDQIFYPEALPAPTFRHARPVVGLPDPGATHRASGYRRHRGRLWPEFREACAKAAWRWARRNLKRCGAWCCPWLALR